MHCVYTKLNGGFRTVLNYNTLCPNATGGSSTIRTIAALLNALGLTGVWNALLLASNCTRRYETD